MSGYDDSGENKFIETGDDSNSSDESSGETNNKSKRRLSLQPLSIFRSTDKLPTVDLSSSKSSDECDSLKRSQSESAFFPDLILKSPKKLRMSLASLSSSKLARRVTVNEYSHFFRFISAPHSPISSRDAESDVRTKVAKRKNSYSPPRSKSLENHYHQRGKLKLSPTFARKENNHIKKRNRSISVFNRPPKISSIDFDSQDEADSFSSGKKFLKRLAPHVSKKKSCSSMTEEISGKPFDPQSSGQGKSKSLAKSGLSLPDEIFASDPSLLFENTERSGQNLGTRGTAATIEDQRAIENLKQKVIKATEMMGKEKILQDENVAEYLKLIANADKQQAQRIKTVFDKKNVKSQANIDRLQRKLEGYQKRIQDLEFTFEKNAGIVDKSELEIEQNFTTGTSQGASQQKISESDLFQNSGKKPTDSKLSGRFSDATNFRNLSEVSSNDKVTHYSTQESFASVNYAMQQLESSHSSLQSKHLQTISSYLKTIQSELETIREAQNHIEHRYGTQVTNLESSLLRQLDEDSIRREEQLNDLIDSQQKEISQMKLELRSLEDKMTYHSNEQARDTEELLDSCQHRITKIEQQQQQHLQGVEILNETAHARALLGKVMNLLLTLLALVFVCVSTVTGLIKPLTKTWAHITVTIIAIVSGFALYTYWDNVAILFVR